MTKPNLIIIMADQLRFDLIGPHTPHINQLLAESMVFNRAYCVSPLCVPARGAFFTGQYPNVTRCRINPWEPSERAYGTVKAGVPNLYSLMENEWDSWHTGKQHLFTEERIQEDPDSRTHWLSLEAGYNQHLKEGGQRLPGGPAFRGILPELVGGRISHVRSYSIPTTGCYEGGFDYFFDGYITHKSLEAIRKRDKTKPFLLNAMFLAPHPPLDIPEPWYSQVQEIDLPDNVGLWCPGQSPLQLYNLTGMFGSRYTRQAWQEIWRVYAGLVALLDDCVGQIITALKEEGLYDDSLILFTSDHGEMLGSHCLWQKMCMYEESVRVPLSFKLSKGWSSVEQSNELVSHLDILPTLCDLLDIDPPPSLPGLSLRPTIETDQPIERDHIFIQFDGNGARGNFQRCLVKGAHKLIVDFFQNEIFFELYKVIQDPQEKQNLAFEDVDTARALIPILQNIMQETGDEIGFGMQDYDNFLRDYAPFQKGEAYYS